jgi:hypothetical protein
MIRSLLCIGFAAAVTGLAGGCDKPPVSTNPDMPIKGSDGVDKKGRKSKSIDATLEDPPRK